MILLDTHAFLWLALEPSRLSQGATTAIRRAVRKDGLGVAAITLWEAVWLVKRGRVRVPDTLQHFLNAAASRFSIRPLTAAIAVRAAQLPTAFPADPADRLIAATALVEDLPLITKDENIRRSGALTTIW